MKLVTVAEMQTIEKQSNEQGWTYSQMMERAGLGLAEIVQFTFGYEEENHVTGLVGSGNNGGDTLVALAELAQSGWTARAYLVKDREGEDDLVQRLLDLGGELARAEEDTRFHTLDGWVAGSSVILDGVFGTGIHLPLKGMAAKVLKRVKHNVDLPPVVAVDCPSGIDLTSGEAADETIPAEITICMAAVKMGLLKFPAFELVGEIEVVDIGLPPDLPAWNAVQREMVTDEFVHALLPHRSPDLHKGTYGTVQVVAGSVNYTGAALLCSRAAYRIGAGLLQVGIPAPLHPALAGQFAEATWVLLPTEMGVIASGALEVLLKKLDRVTVLLWGPGFGMEDPTAEFVRKLVEGKGLQKGRGGIGFLSGSQAGGEERAETRLPPMVIDADGLKLMARVDQWWKSLPGTAVLTPHPGEMSILTGKSVADIQADRLEIARQYAQTWGHVVVLKGAMTVISAPDGRTAVIPVATSALAHAGTGDVLSGMIAGLRAQGMEAFEAAAAGAYLHARAGLLAAEEIGHEASVAAGDLIEVLPEVLSWVWS